MSLIFYPYPVSHIGNITLLFIFNLLTYYKFTPEIFPLNVDSGLGVGTRIIDIFSVLAYDRLNRYDFHALACDRHNIYSY